MADKKYFVNNGQANVGPFEMHAIIEKINKAELKATDHICVSVDNDEWVLICQHPEFLKHYEAAAKSEKPTIGKSVPVEQSANNNDAGVWIEPTSDQPSDGLTVIAPSTSKNNVIRITPEPQRSATPNESFRERADVAHTHTAIETPVPETTRTNGGDLTAGQWYVLKGRNRFGPFTYLDVIRMLQEKSVFEYDYVWCSGLDTWKRIAQVVCFSAEHIEALFTDGKENEQKIFHRRNYKRSKYEITVIAHDNKSVWKGKTLEVSEGGAGIVITNAMILPGQNVYLHFAPGPLSKPFNVLCEIVSKRYMGGLRDSSSPVIYGVKFVNITKQDKEVIKNLHSAA